MDAFGHFNGTNLVPGREADRRALLEKMRSKLVSGPQPDPRHPDPANRAARASARKRKASAKAWAAAVILVQALAGANAWVYLNKDRVLGRLGVKVLAKPAAPPRELTEAERALYWAYAAWAPDKFRSRFGASPDGMVPVRADAAHRAERMLRDGVPGPAVRREMLALREAAGAALPREARADERHWKIRAKARAEAR